MKKCPYCAELIRSEASVCRYCGRDLPESALPGKDLSKPITKKQAYIIVGITIAILIIWSTSSIIGDIVNPPKPTPTMEPRNAAWWACRLFIEKNLKVPENAEYEDVDLSQVDWYRTNPEHNIHTFVVDMNVRAENSFGVKTVSLFTCKVMKTGSQWELLDLFEN